MMSFLPPWVILLLRRSDSPAKLSSVLLHIARQWREQLPLPIITPLLPHLSFQLYELSKPSKPPRPHRDCSPSTPCSLLPPPLTLLPAHPPKRLLNFNDSKVVPSTLSHATTSVKFSLFACVTAHGKNPLFVAHRRNDCLAVGQ